MNKNSSSLAHAQQEFERLRRQLGQMGYFSQGSVQDRTGRQGGGAGYQWTRKVAQKTVSVSLRAEQFEPMKRAVDNYRKLRRLLKEMEVLSRKIIFLTTPHPSRRKQLSPRVLGLN
jgi:hypothetical protein